MQLLQLLMGLEGGASTAQLRPDARDAVAALEAVSCHLPHQLVEDHLVPPHDPPHLLGLKVGVRVGVTGEGKGGRRDA